MGRDWQAREGNNVLLSGNIGKGWLRAIPGRGVHCPCSWRARKTGPGRWQPTTSCFLQYRLVLTASDAVCSRFCLHRQQAAPALPSAPQFDPFRGGGRPPFPAVCAASGSPRRHPCPRFALVPRSIRTQALLLPRSIVGYKRLCHTTQALVLRSCTS